MHRALLSGVGSRQKRDKQTLEKPAEDNAINIHPLLHWYGDGHVEGNPVIQGRVKTHMFVVYVTSKATHLQDIQHPRIAEKQKAD